MDNCSIKYIQKQDSPGSDGDLDRITRRHSSKQKVDPFHGGGVDEPESYV